MRGTLGPLAVVALVLAGCTYDAVLPVPSNGAGSGGAIAVVTPDSAVLDAPLEPDPISGVDITVEVRSDDARHRISPWIYGIRGNTDFAENRQGLFSPAEIRWSTYNWENNASNNGYLTNQNGSELSGSDRPGDAVAQLLSATAIGGVRPVVVVPIGRRLAADKYGTDVRTGEGASDYLATRFVENRAAAPSEHPLGPDLNDAVVFQSEFLRWLQSGFPSADPVFVLDEEPDLWTTTIPAARPEPLTYGELLQRNIEFAAAIKGVWPDAPVLGFASYGWAGWETLRDPVTSEDPVDAEGAFLDYYLDGMRAVEAEGGRRLIDGVDLHWFSEARGADGDGVRIVESADATAAEARVQAPRSLWDPTYRERSWIVDDVIHGPIALIPTLRQRIEAHYPGTELVLGSWLFGGELHISGAIAVADVLGVLGRQQVQIAALARGSRFSLAGFRVFTNYDGTGSRFGDLSIGATSADVEALTAYASVDSQDLDRVTVVLINKREIPTRTGVRVHHPTLLSAAECFQLTAEQEAIVRCPQLRATGTNGFVHEMPAWSITLLVVRAG